METYKTIKSISSALDAKDPYTHGHSMRVTLYSIILAKELNLDDNTLETIETAGLLHDIGRWQEYEQGIRHEIAGSILAPAILKDCGFTESETKEIVLAVSNHRNSEIKEELSLSGYLYRADKKSRPCFLCEAEKECDWSREKKNLRIV